MIILNAVIRPSVKSFILQPTELTISRNVLRLRLTSFRFTEIENLHATKETETVTWMYHILEDASRCLKRLTVLTQRLGRYVLEHPHMTTRSLLYIPVCVSARKLSRGLLKISTSGRVWCPYLHYFIGVRVGAVGWGTAPHVRRSAVRFPMISLEFFMVLGLTQPLTEMSTRNISWGVKAAGAYGWQPYHLPCPEGLEIWEPRPPGTLWACPGL